MDLTTQSVRTCRWGTPTLLLPWPLWCDAADHEWSCTRAVSPRLLPDPGVCRKCLPWQPADDDRHRRGETTL